MPTNQPRHTIIVPSETQSREFDAKLLLACTLAEKGHPTIVGSRIAIHNHIHKLNHSIYLAKDFRKPSTRMFRILKGLGTTILAWDEEGVLVFDQKLYHERRVHAPNLAQIREFFAWGPLNKHMISTAPGYHGQTIHLSGNPRVDMLRPELRSTYDRDVELLMSRFGKFILINTNFGMLNHFLPTHVVTPDGKDRSTGGDISAEMKQAWQHQTLVFEAFKKMVAPLAERFADCTIVIRPHPGESLKVWQDIAGECKNVLVLHEGPVQPWLLACAAMVHSSCTTGIEGFLLGAKVISYRPVQSDNFDHKMSNDLSYQVFTLDSLLKAVADALQGLELDQRKPARDMIIAELFESLTGEFAADRIASRIAEIANTEDLLQPRYFFARQMAKLHSVSRATVRIITSRMPNHKNSTAYTHKRFPGVSLAYVQQRVTDYRRALDRFEKVSVKKISENVFVVE